MPQDTTQAIAQDGQWMSYGELARVRGIDRQSAVKLVRRHNWRRQPGNNGEVRVFVPADGLSRPMTRDETPDETRAETRPIAPDTTAFEAALAAIEAAHASEVTALRERADAAEMSRVATQAIADKALIQLTEANKRAAQAELAINGERARADGLRDQLEAIRVQLATTEAEAKAANDRAWASGQQQAAAERRADIEQGRADRLEAQAVHEREDLLDAEVRTRRELETVSERVAEAEANQDRLRAEVDGARAELTEVRRAEDERKGRGRWARLRAAWLGE